MTRDDARLIMRNLWMEAVEDSFTEEALEIAIKALEQPEWKKGKCERCDDSDRLRMEIEKLKCQIECMSRQAEKMRGEIKALSFAVRCNGVSGNEVHYE